MNADTKTSINLSAYVLCGLIFIGGLGWLLASFLLGQIPSNEFIKVASGFGITISKAVFIGSSVGFALSYYLGRAFGKTPTAIPKESGITTIYPDRILAADEYINLIKNKKINKVDIVGISLREFLSGGGTLKKVWEAICYRLKEEETANLRNAKRLTVRILILDRNSAEGLFRHNSEKETIGRAGLPLDVPQSIEEVKRVRFNILSEDTYFLKIKLYEHCPFCFMFLTELCAFVEQYNYRDHKTPQRMPLLKYDGDSRNFHQLSHSFEIIWANAIEPRSDNQVGTAEAVYSSRMKNIFRHDQRAELSQREIECLNAIEKCPEATVDILAISGRFYTSNPIRETLIDIASKTNQQSCKVRIALLNPISQQAILRAVADSCAAEEISQTLQNWIWNQHVKTSLYVDVHRTVREFQNIIARGRNIEIHLYSCSVACALLLTPNAGFVEQYIYGRSIRHQKDRTLGGQCPCIEYELKDTIEEEIFRASFDVIWNSYSIDISKYDNGAEEAEFQATMSRIHSIFKCKQDMESVSKVDGLLPKLE